MDYLLSKKYRLIGVILLFLLALGLIFGNLFLNKYSTKKPKAINTTTRDMNLDLIENELKKSPVLEEQIKETTTTAKIKIRQTLDYEILYDKNNMYFQVVVLNATSSGTIRKKVEDYFRAINANPNNLPIYYYIKR